MPIPIIVSPDPYVYDKVQSDPDLPAISRKNATFFEAVVRLDSSYRKDFDVTAAPHPNYEPERDYDDADGKYYGSIAYWFAKMEEAQEGPDYRKALLGATISIDSTNSTHVAAAVDGRRQMREIIYARCPNVNRLKEELSKAFGQATEDHLLIDLTIPMPARSKEGTRSNISFASKFCSYGAKFLGTPFEYSKYDGVVSLALPRYLRAYLGTGVGKRHFIANSAQAEKIRVYKEYCQVILDIIASSGALVTKEEFDHIVWYALK